MATAAVTRSGISTLLPDSHSAVIPGWAPEQHRDHQRAGLRLHHHPRLVLLRRALHGAPVRAPSGVVSIFSNIANGLMALPNLIGLLLLSGIVVKETRDYMSQKDWKTRD